MENPYAQVYGLTGVMGSGKSTVAELLRAEGAFVLDADEIARFVIDPTSPWYTQLKAKLIAAFGVFSSSSLFAADGRLDRALLASVTFGHEDRVRLLNNIMHPVIQREFATRLLRAEEGVPVVYDVPLLFETGLEKKLKATILVYAPEATCVARAVTRAAAKGQPLTAEEARHRLRSQISIEKKRELADYIIDNSGDFEALKPQVAGLYQRLRGL
ncbi:MAG TPA: dephospho-CoA kinase [Turneriella sp.]|nr:dephospho-CoA kinase [Turneriella sp.]HNE20198.1 dephospho-CoA kinase [Turneriella sp.]HNL54072.1 dephospho-CoA kinase [Turneriella sp.]HNN00629.1 dephospho-CoA kinase [Turneriella sp.]